MLAINAARPPHRRRELAEERLELLEILRVAIPRGVLDFPRSDHPSGVSLIRLPPLVPAAAPALPPPPAPAPPPPHIAIIMMLSPTIKPAPPPFIAPAVVSLCGQKCGQHQEGHGEKGGRRATWGRSRRGLAGGAQGRCRSRHSARIGAHPSEGNAHGPQP